jgi:hypothetical protein
MLNTKLGSYLIILHRVLVFEDGKIGEDVLSSSWKVKKNGAAVGKFPGRFASQPDTRSTDLGSGSADVAVEHPSGSRR